MWSTWTSSSDVRTARVSVSADIGVSLPRPVATLSRTHDSTARSVLFVAFGTRVPSGAWAKSRFPSEGEPMPSAPMSPPEHRSDPLSRRRMSTAATVAVVVLLAIPCVALALVPTYSSETPMLLGWPFFYWYQLLWVLITPILTWSAFLIIRRSRGER